MSEDIKKPDAAADRVAFEKLNNQEWKEVFFDSCTDDWKDKWFMDGEISHMQNTEKGMQLSAGPQLWNDSHHTVLWTNDEFTGDLKIEFDYTRLDFSERCVNIIYIQATGSGVGPYDTDITKWNDLRKTPAMSMYFDHMNTYHISFAAFPEDYIRARRYIPESTGLGDTDLAPDYFNYGLFAPGMLNHFSIIKRDDELVMKISNSENEYYFHWINENAPIIKTGRIGLRHMFTRSASYKNIRISQP
jgi:hypothetical protein